MTDWVNSPWVTSSLCKPSGLRSGDRPSAVRYASHGSDTIGETPQAPPSLAFERHRDLFCGEKATDGHRMLSRETPIQDQVNVCHGRMVTFDRRRGYAACGRLIRARSPLYGVCHTPHVTPPSPTRSHPPSCSPAPLEIRRSLEAETERVNKQSRWQPTKEADHQSTHTHTHTFRHYQGNTHTATNLFPKRIHLSATASSTVSSSPLLAHVHVLRRRSHEPSP